MQIEVENEIINRIQQGIDAGLKVRFGVQKNKNKKEKKKEKRRVRSGDTDSLLFFGTNFVLAAVRGTSFAIREVRRL